MTAPTQHPTLPDWLFIESGYNDGNTVWITRAGYRHDMPQDEPLFTVKSPLKGAVSQQFVMHAREWDRQHDKKHNHKRKQKTT